MKMRTILQVLMLVLLATPSYADILNCTLDQYEMHDPIAQAIRLDKIKSADGKDSPISVVLAGLDSSKVTAKGGLYAISVEEQIYPMSQGWGLAGTESEWYYVKHESGIAVFELSRKARRRESLRVLIVHDKN